MPTSSIGTATFISMDPPPTAAVQQIVLESKAGVNGHGAFLTGSRQAPQQVTTVRDFTSFALAVAAKAVYESAVGSVLAVVYGGVGIGNALILGVDCQCQALVGAVGGLSGSPAAVVTARWTLEMR